MQHDRLIAENERLQRCVSDLASVMALPAMWVGRKPSQIVGSLLDSVLGMLDLDFAHLHLNEANDDVPLKVTRLSHWANNVAPAEEFEALLTPWLNVTAQELPRRLTTADSNLAVLAVRLGLLGEIGLLVVGSRRTNFPLQTESLLIHVAVNQAVLGLQAAWQLRKQEHLSRELDHRVEVRTRQLAKANAELRRREREFQMVIDAIPAIVWSAHADGRVDFVNQHFCKYVGLSTKEAQKWGWISVVHPDDLPILMNDWRTILASGRAGEFHARLRRFDGEHRWFLFRADPLADAGGNFKWFGACVDVHDWKKAQDELRETQADLAHVARVTTMGQLTASITHELNQPLSGIMTNASACLRMLSAERPNMTGAKETARRMIRDTNRATEVIARLRTLFKRHDTAVDVVNVNEAIQEVVALASTELQKARVTLHIELSDNLAFVKGDRTQLQQVIMNLTLNAIEAMDGMTDRSKDLIIATERDEDEHVRITVRDAGVGVDPTTVEKLFQPFHTTKSNGMGIGLSVSRSIVESHHGRLWAETNDGPGATFLVAIPAWQNGRPAAREL